MILITHPRSGSEWFFDCTPETRYTNWEIFSGLSNFTTDGGSRMPAVSLNAKSAILKNAGTKSYKIMFYQFWQEVPVGHRIVEELQARDDVYLLRRRNTRAAIISQQTAANNGLNYHGNPDKLTKKFDITRESIVDWAYRMHGVFEEPALRLNYREELWYEDLLAGRYPLTINFRDTSHRPIRNSVKLNLVQNIDQVNAWMDELGVPGDLGR
jgi:hypothetical protein